MHTLYGSQGSGSAIVEAALELAGAPYRIVDAASWDASSDLEALRAVNPLLQIPALVLPDGGVMTESAAILIHLAEAHPRAGLLPADAAARAQAIRGLVYVAANCYPAVGIIDYPDRWCADCDEATAERIRRGTRARLHRCWEIFADTFATAAAGKAPAFDPSAPGALALMATVVSTWCGTRAHLQQHRPAFFAQLQAVERHARIAPVFARHWDAA